MTIRTYRPAAQLAARRPFLLSTVAVTWISAAVLSSLELIQRTSWDRLLRILRIIIVHIVPAGAVVASHLGVHAKLTALSLKARAKHGELPLPMPLMRRPTHVIIVAGIPNRHQPNPQNANVEIVEVRNFLIATVTLIHLCVERTADVITNAQYYIVVILIVFENKFELS